MLELYRLTANFTEEERFGVVSQLRRAAASVPTNIAEGAKRTGAQDYARFLNIAEGSLSETEYLVMLSRDLGYVGLDDATRLLVEIEAITEMLFALRTKVKQRV